MAWSRWDRRMGIESWDRVFREQVKANRMMGSIRVCTERKAFRSPNIEQKKKPRLKSRPLLKSNILLKAKLYMQTMVQSQLGGKKGGFLLSGEEICGLIFSGVQRFLQCGDLEVAETGIFGF